MTLKLQLLLIAFSIFSLLILVRMVVRYRLELKYSLLWLLLSGILILLSIFPNIPYVFTYWLGFEKPVNFIFFVGVMLSMAIIFSLTISLSRISGKITSLSQEIGLLKLELQAIKEQKESDGTN